MLEQTLQSGGFPLISLMILTLPLAAALIWTVDASRARWIALCAALIDLALALGMVGSFDHNNAGFQFIERSDWIPDLNIEYLVGIDGISVLLFPLTILLFVGVIVASWNNIRTLPRLYYTLLLLLESATLGIFSALDTLLFFLFWELTLIPIYFLISLWGIGPNRRYAAVKYTLFMLTGGVPILFGFILTAFHHAGLAGIEVPAGLVFDYTALLANPLPTELQTTVFLLLLLGFAVKVPVFPLHSWLPTVAMEGPVAIAAIMTGVKLGAYGLLRFALPLAPEAAHSFHWLLAGLGVTGIVYGAMMALAQTNLRRMLAFASMSHVGLIVLGIASFNIEGIQGALFQLMNFTVVAGGLFLLTGFLHQRTGSSDYINLGGTARTMPLLAAFFLLFGLAGMGLPGTNGFPAEFLLLVGTLKTHTGAGLAALVVIVLETAYFMGYYRRAFYGPIHSQVVRDAVDLRGRELLLASVYALLILAAGLYPQGVLDITRNASELWLAHVNAP